MQPYQTSCVTKPLPLAYQAATEPVGGVSSSIPLHPDDHPPDSGDHKRKEERKPPHDSPGGDTGKKPPDPEHQIDEYACPVQTGCEMIL